jgi:hypothetical protein
MIAYFKLVVKTAKKNTATQLTSAAASVRL